jgi:alpha-1,2-mannosyltransferase
VKSWTGWARTGLLVSLLAEVLVLVIGLNSGWHASILRIELLSVPLFAVALFCLSRAGLSPRRALLLVIGAGIILQVGAVAAAPTSSDDVYRYVWDGKVQLAGIDPYRYPPDASQLDRLHGPVLFGDRPKCAWRLPDGTCTRINRPTVRTVYPPVAQGAFTLARLGTLGLTDSTTALQAMAALASIGLSILLARRATRGGRPPWTVAVWAWCPVTVVELGNNGHIDGLAVLLSVAALVSASSRKPGWAGILLGAAIATKLYPALLLPVLLRRRPSRVIGAAVATVALVYLPHVLAVGLRVIGFLPGYLREEGYGSGSRFLLLSAPLKHEFVLRHPHLLSAAAAIILAVAAGPAAWWSDPKAPELTAVWLTGVVLLVTTPSYSWYSVLLLALVAMTAKIEWLPLAILPTFAMLWADHFARLWLSYFEPGVAFRTSCYALGLLCAVLGATARRLHSKRPAHRIGTPAVT